MLVLLPLFGTEPFDDSLTVSKDGKCSVQIKAWEDDKERILFIKTPKGKSGLTMEELGFDAGPEDYPTITTAGWDWYQNSITHIDPDTNIFAIRLKSSKTIYLDLNSRTVVNKLADKVVVGMEKVFAEKANKMLKSKDSRKRETGAIFVGQLKVKKAIPVLRKLLSDRSWFTLTSGDEPTMVILYVRQAAKTALESMGQKVEGVVTELPKEGHVIEKNYQYILRLDGDKVEQKDETPKTNNTGNKEEW